MNALQPEAVEEELHSWQLESSYCLASSKPTSITWPPTVW
jgi:hypothetical protein